MKNIILTGLMGSGKSSTAKELNLLLPEFKLFETDEIIVKKEKMPITEIFETKGEKYFRMLEKQVIDDLLPKSRQIISLGGGSLENDFDFELAKKTSIIFYLKADVDILYERIKNDKSRPLLNCENPKEKLKNLLNLREEKYKKSDYTINVARITCFEAAKEIVRIYNDETGSN